MKITGAEAVIRVLLEHGVDTVFGYPGGTMQIISSLYCGGQGQKNSSLRAERSRLPRVSAALLCARLSCAREKVFCAEAISQAT